MQKSGLEGYDGVVGLGSRLGGSRGFAGYVENMDVGELRVGSKILLGLLWVSMFV